MVCIKPVYNRISGIIVKSQRANKQIVTFCYYFSLPRPLSHL